MSNSIDNNVSASSGDHIKANAADHSTNSFGAPLNQSPGKVEEETSGAYHQSNSENDQHSTLEVDHQWVQRYVNQIYSQEGNTIEIRPDGSIVITPRPCKLPTEILSMIIHCISEQQHQQQQQRPNLPLNFLYQCTLVSRQFYSIANPLLWKSPDLPNPAVSKLFLDCLAHIRPQSRQKSTGQYIRQLDLDGYFWTNARFKRLLSRTMLLTDLTISAQTRITDEGFQQTLFNYYLPHLTAIKLIGFALTHVFFAELTDSSPQLHSLHLMNCYNVSAQIIALLTRLPLLKRFVLQNTSIRDKTRTMMILQHLHHLTDLVIDSVSSHSMQALLHQVTTSTTALPPPPLSSSSSPIATFSLSSCWPQLITLHLGRCRKTDDNTWAALIKANRQLQEIKLVFPVMMTDTTLDRMARYLPSLTRLTLYSASNITPQGVHRLILHATSPRLTTIFFDSCDHIHPIDFPEADPFHAGMSQIYLDRWAIDEIKDQAQAE